MCMFPSWSTPACSCHDLASHLWSLSDCFSGQDGNMGLVKQAVSALTKRKITQLTHTYITLPLIGKPGTAMAIQRVLH